MKVANQIAFEAAQSGHIPLAIFSKYNAPIGAGTEMEGRNAGRFLRGILSGAGVACGEFALQFCAEGVLVFLSVGDADLALSELWGAFARCDCEDNCWIARQEADGSWRSLFPKRDETVTLPPEVTLLPARFYLLQSEFAQVNARQDGLDEALRLGTVTDDDAAAQSAAIAERREAVRAEMNAFKSQLTGGQS